MSILDDNSGLNMSSTGLRVSGEMKRNWSVTSKWALFLAIIGFIYIAFTLFSLGTTADSLQAMSMMMGDNPMLEMVGRFMPFMNVFSLIVVAVMFFINFYHLRFATQLQKALNFNDQPAFVKSWMNLRNHFMIFGIMVCVLLAFYIVLLIIGLSLMSGTNNLG
mgnify:CR=1 FL=1